MNTLNNSWIEIIAAVRPGETINLSTTPPSLSLHNTWSTWRYRWWNGEDQDKLGSWLSIRILDLLNNTTYVTPNLRQILGMIATGLRNLAITYQNYRVYETIDMLIKRVESRIFNG